MQSHFWQWNWSKRSPAKSNPAESNGSKSRRPQPGHPKWGEAEDRKREGTGWEAHLVECPACQVGATRLLRALRQTTISAHSAGVGRRPWQDDLPRVIISQRLFHPGVGPKLGPPPAADRRLARHLAHCPACREERDQIILLFNAEEVGNLAEPGRPARLDLGFLSRPGGIGKETKDTTGPQE